MNGVMYIAFGEKAKKEVGKSADSVMNITDNSVLIACVGDQDVEGVIPIKWTSSAPFSGVGRHSFRAGSVKPFLYGSSPFENTLYLDADTIVKRDFREGFQYLEDVDICVSYHVKPNGDIWYVDEIFEHPLSQPISDTSIKERDLTQKMIGKRMPFINSGVIFFRKSEATDHLFREWYSQWELFKGWDEQMALHRAICKCPETKVFLLPPKWNQKYENKDTIILHRMGKQSARKDKI